MGKLKRRYCADTPLAKMLLTIVTGFTPRQPAALRAGLGGMGKRHDNPLSALVRWQVGPARGAQFLSDLVKRVIGSLVCSIVIDAI